MALCFSPPGGCPYDEDEDVAVLESTAAEYRGPSRPRLPEISVISPGLDSQLSIIEPVSVHICVLLLSRSASFKNGSKTRKHLSVPSESGSSASGEVHQC